MYRYDGVVIDGAGCEAPPTMPFAVAHSVNHPPKVSASALRNC